MKKLVVLTLASLISGQTIAQDFICRAAYERQIEKLENKTANSASRNMIYGGGSIAAGAVIAFVAVAPVLIPLGALGGAYVVFSDRHLIKNLHSFKDAKSAIEEAVTSREEALRDLKSRFDLYQLWNAEFARRAINERRMKEGLPALTFEEYIRQNPLPQFDPTKQKSPIERITETLNREYGTTYEEVAEAIKELARNDVLCPENKPLGLKKLVKMVSKNL